ncbi:MAG: S9 family peptidase, partial [Bacillota bacterium]
GVLDFCPGNLGVDLPEVRTVTAGDYSHDGPAWSPDGKWIAVSACREKDPDMQRFSDIWVFPVEGGDPVKITRSWGPAHAPSWSPDGETIAYLGNRREVYGFYTNTRLWLAEVGDLSGEEFELVDLTKGTDVSFGDVSITDMRFAGPPPRLTWSEDGAFIYHLTSERGTTQVVRVDASSGSASLVTTGDRVVFNADLRPDLGRAALAVADAKNPSQLHLLDLGASGDLEAGQFTDSVLDAGLQSAAERVIVRTNEELLSEGEVPVAERFTVRAAEDAPDVDCWILMPESQEERIPAVLQIHGGPTAMYAGTFFFEFQLLAAAGYTVVFTNPRGSSGYGEDFRGAIKDGWGDPDYADIMAGIDGALERHPEIDPGRLGVAGGSYGGYMTNWVIGHTDRFAAAVTMRCVSDLYSFWGASDIGYLWDELYEGHPWETTEIYRQQSPITYMGDVKTPTLVIHSEEDHRCPINQGEQVFTTLKKQGVETEFIRYPGESHGLSRGGRPWHRIHRLERIVEWYDRYM